MARIAREGSTVRLSEWCASAPARDAVSPKVLAVAEPLLAPTAGGLVTLAIPVHTPQEGPRASGKLIRWSRVQVGDLGVEMQGGHRFVSPSLEGVVLRGMDAEAHRIGANAG
jgi:hypothetical protein